MKNILIIILILNSLFIYSEQLSAYNFETIKVLQTGNKEGQIGWQPAIAGMFSGPISFCITQKRIIYLPDRVNRRLNVYDMNFNLLKTIIEEEEQYVHYTPKIKADNNGNIIYLSYKSGIKKINDNGATLLSVSYKQIPDEVKHRYNFFPIADNIFIYNDENKIECITNKGEFLKGDKIKLEIDRIKNEWANESRSDFMKLPSDKRKIIEDLQEDNSFLMINDNFYSTDFGETKKYFNKIEEIKKYVTTQKKSAKSEKIELNIEDFSMHFIDYDVCHNSYWDGSIAKSKKSRKYAVIIYSKYGELLDAFYYGQYDNYEPNYELYPTTGAVIAVSPDGDVYFLIGNKKEYTFYKVERRW